MADPAGTSFGVVGASEAARASGSGRTRAFIIEALLLTAVLAFCLAVLMSAFGRAIGASQQADELVRASAVAQSVAERFAADPEAVAAAGAAWDEDGFLVACAVGSTQQEGGTFWSASISVTDDGADPLVSIETARFVAGGPS